MSLDTDLAREWLRVEKSLTRDLTALARDLAQARARGAVVNLGTLAGHPRYLSLVSALGLGARPFAAPVATFAGTAAIEIARLSDRQATLAQSQVRSYLAKLGANPYQSARLRTEFVDRQAQYRWLLEQGVGPDALNGLQRNLLQAVAKGESPVDVTRAAQKGLTQGLNRAMLLSRDGPERAYREAADQEMLASGQVASKQRLTQRYGACPACLSKDGEVLPVSEPGYDHPGGKCRFRPILVGQNPVRRSAEAWFRTQPAEYQRDLLGNARYEALRVGRITFAALSVETFHPTYGKGLRLAPVPPQTTGV